MILERCARLPLSGQDGDHRRTGWGATITDTDNQSHLQAVAEELGSRVSAANQNRRPPRATYRLQFHAGFRFSDATVLVPYLADLGISHLYASPIFRAVPGSTHGYDVIDQNQLNPEIGTRAEFDALVEALHRHGMGLILDIVPNHMGIGRGLNPWWQDVLENGRVSPYAVAFDIDWTPLKKELRNKVLLPVLGDQYGAVLEAGELDLTEADGAFTVCYYETPLPISPATYGLILRAAEPVLLEGLEPDDLTLLEFQSITAGFERLGSLDPDDPEQVAERIREGTTGKVRLARLLADSELARTALNEVVERFNGTPGDPASFDAMDRLLDAQNYRLAYWRVAAEEINYRRFFAINDLAAIRQERPEVFAATHRLLLELIEAGAVDGIRIDHPDGLWDPGAYFRDLQMAAFLAKAERLAGAEVDWTDLGSEVGEWWIRQWQTDPAGPGLRAVYLVVEKILARSEELPRDWMVDGTVGYDFLDEVNALFVNPQGRADFDRLYTRFTGQDQTFPDMTYDTRYLIMRVALTSEVNVLANVLNTVSEHNRRTRDFTLNDLRNALRAVIACFPVYRTYADPHGGPLQPADKAAIELAVREAIRRNPEQERSVFQFIRRTLTAPSDEDEGTAGDLARLQFNLKLQQLTGSVMAKGLEDTAFYRFNRLTSLNEVGSDPNRFGALPGEVHTALARREREWPDAMLASSTHDTKRSEDVRARMSALSGFPRDWRAAINRWARLNRRHRTRVEGSAAPDRADEYLLYQTLLGAWPGIGAVPDDVFVERMTGYMQKAVREAQRRSNWANPNTEYENALETFVRTLLDPAKSDAFLADFGGMAERVIRAGWFTSLAATVLKLTSPGVPDFYQGTELWDLSLVDPDNRRPVDFAARQATLRRLRKRAVGSRLVRDLVDRAGDGRIKLHVIWTLLHLRAEMPHLFACGSYRSLPVTGALAGHVFAFERRHEGATAIVVVPKLVDALLHRGTMAPVGEEIWGDTRIEPGEAGADRIWRNVLTGEQVTQESGVEMLVADALWTFPVAVLVGNGND